MTTWCSNGADYSYTMTLIHTQADKLGEELGGFLRSTMLPAMYAGMEARGWPTCPYVNPVKDSPDHGLAEFLETARFSTGYAALHHTIGFMPETHMLKPFQDRYESMRALVETALEFTVNNAGQIQALRRAARQRGRTRAEWPIHWAMDETNPSSFRFKGYEAKYKQSVLGTYTRLWYDRSSPWERDIAYYNSFPADITVLAPRAYIVPLDQDNARYAVETLEPQGHDSFFRWGFFNSVLEKKEAYSDYVFEDHAAELLNDEPALAAKFEEWKRENAALLGNQEAVLDFIFANCERYREPEWRRYPVFMVR